jgi:hypothetical protein
MLGLKAFAGPETGAACVDCVKRRTNEAREGAAELIEDVTDTVARKVAMS